MHSASAFSIAFSIRAPGRPRYQCHAQQHGWQVCLAPFAPATQPHSSRAVQLTRRRLAAQLTRRRLSSRQVGQPRSDYQLRSSHLLESENAVAGKNAVCGGKLWSRSQRPTCAVDVCAQQLSSVSATWRSGARGLWAFGSESANSRFYLCSSSSLSGSMCLHRHCRSTHAPP